MTARCMKVCCSSGISSALKLVGCNVYVSEGQNTAVLRQLEEVILSHPGVALVASFTDTDYHRTSFSLASTSTQKLSGAVVDVTRQALEHVDMSQHQATHPRLGAVDHISCHPVTPDTPMAWAAETAMAVANQLGQPPTNVPVYLYGAVHPDGRTLAEIRRQLGYFQSRGFTPTGGDSGVWRGLQQGVAGGASLSATHTLTVLPDVGPPQMSPTVGVSTIGAVPWVVNFNIPLLTNDLAAVKQIARAVSQRGGGLPAVEAMALTKDGTVEVACNLLDVQLSSRAQVLERVRRLAGELSVKCGQAYQIGLSVDDVARKVLESLQEQLEL